MLFARTHGHGIGREADIVTGGKRDFAALLDDLFAASEHEGEGAARPSIPFDYLAVAEELHSGRISVSSESLAAEYRESGGDLAAEFAALLDQAKLAMADAASTPQEPLPPVDAESIAAELGLDPARPADFDRLRRDFAFSNHPDRVAHHLKQRAMVRMQVANMLIDEAKRKAKGRKRG